MAAIHGSGNTFFDLFDMPFQMPTGILTCPLESIPILTLDYALKLTTAPLTTEDKSSDFFSEATTTELDVLRSWHLEEHISYFLYLLWRLAPDQATLIPDYFDMPF